MAETADWKQKYRDSFQELQTEEVRWRLTEQVLRRLVGRPCAAGMGHKPQLDDELAALAAANRRSAAAEELARMADSLTNAVLAVDATSPVRVISRPVATPPQQHDPRRCGSVAEGAAGRQSSALDQRAGR